MRNLSDHIHDLVENSVDAGASTIWLTLELFPVGLLHGKIEDDGKGIPEELIAQVKHPSYTTRTTRKLGLGLALMEQNSQNCGGELRLESKLNGGTTLDFTWNLNHVDCLPLGDLDRIFFFLTATRDDLKFVFSIKFDGSVINWDTNEIKETVYPLSFGNQEIRTAVSSMLRSDIKAFKSYWNSIITIDELK
mgnify:CR=1 FL=1